MYSRTKEDYDYIFKTVDNFRSLSKTGTLTKSLWSYVADSLNEHFSTNFSPSQWKNQYDAGVKRLKKFGNAEGFIMSETRINTKKNKKTKKPTLDELKSSLKNILGKEKSLNEIKEGLQVDYVTALGLIQALKNDNYNITHNSHLDTYFIDKKPVMDSKEYRHIFGDTKEFEFLVIGDNHWCTKHQQKSFVDYIYSEAVRRGIKNVYHVGDIVDGFYKNRPEHIFELFLIGADEQKDYVVNNWPKHEGITTHLILGNHDETHIKNGGFNIGRAIAKERPDFVYLGIGHAKIWLTPNCRMDLFHPLDGSSYAISYSGQKYMDSISGGDKPNIIFTGHHHKALYFPYRNIHYFEVPSMTQQSSWMKRKRIANESGAWFIKLLVDEEGTIVNLIPEHIKQYKFLENDY